MVAQQKKSGWFFNKNIIDEINSVPEERVENEEQTPPAAQAQTQAKPAPALKMVSDNTIPETPEKQAEEILNIYKKLMK